VFYFAGNCDAESQRQLQLEYGVNSSVRVGGKQSLARATACGRLQASCSNIQRGPYFRYAVFLPGPG
jgi:hypothetical protein